MLKRPRSPVPLISSRILDDYLVAAADDVDDDGETVPMPFAGR